MRKHIGVQISCEMTKHCIHDHMICLRYIMLAYVLCLRRISGALCEMFPTNESLIERGLATRWDFQLVRQNHPDDPDPDPDPDDPDPDHDDQGGGGDAGGRGLAGDRFKINAYSNQVQNQNQTGSKSKLTTSRCLGRVWHAPLSWANVMIRRFDLVFHF